MLSEAKNVLPEFSNTLAENTQKNGLVLRVDWVSVSFVTATDLHQIWHLIGVSQLENLEIISGSRYGYVGYDTTLKLGHMEILFNSNESRYFINFSGQACREYELLSSWDFVTFFALLSNFYPTYTRVDIAIDDYKNIYNVNMIRKAVKQKRVVTRLREWGDSTRGTIANGDDFLTMDNFYMGSSSSRYFINVYDKKLERLTKGYEVEYDTWTRTEIRFKNKYAEKIVREILISTEDFGKVIFAFLNEKIQILTADALKMDDNKSRLAKDYDNHARWWRKFLNTTKKVKLTVYQPDLPLAATEEWLFKQVTSSLAMLNMYYDATKWNTFLHKMLTIGQEKMKDKHLQKIADQFALDRIIEEGNASIEWHKTEVKPKQEVIQKLSKIGEIEKKDKKRSDLIATYYKTKHEQDRKEKQLANANIN